MGLLEKCSQFFVFCLELYESSVGLAGAVLLSQTLDSGVLSVFEDLVAVSWQDQAHAEECVLLND